jgi:integrase
MRLFARLRGRGQPVEKILHAPLRASIEDSAPRFCSVLAVFSECTDAIWSTDLNRHNVTQRSFKPLLAKAGLPQIRFHDLRHTAATVLLSRGVHPKYVQELLGHATIAITLDTYSHVLPQMGGETASAMDAALS